MKLKVAVLCGGRSGEHEVSLKSAASIIGALDKEKYEIIPIGITREGTWLSGEDPLEALSSGKLPGKNKPLFIVPDPRVGGVMWLEEGPLSNKPEGSGSPGESNRFSRLSQSNQPVQSSQLIRTGGAFEKLDVIFPVLHGTYGEDGTVQGLLELAGIPYVGPGVLGASAGMDKIIMKMIYQQAGLPIGKYVYFLKREWEENRRVWLDRIEEELGYPCFVKPSNMGSSVGISRAKGREELSRAVEEAGLWDRRIVVEENIRGREIEVSVLGNDQPEASVPGEIVPSGDFYDYKAKYIDDRSRLIIPAELNPRLAARIRDLAIKSFKALDCTGMGRVDFFVDEKEERITINEINTIPGFTQVSMYPKLWEASGLSYSQLLDRLIQLAIERFEEKKELKTTFNL